MSLVRLSCPRCSGPPAPATFEPARGRGEIARFLARDSAESRGARFLPEMKYGRNRSRVDSGPYLTRISPLAQAWLQVAAAARAPTAVVVIMFNCSVAEQRLVADAVPLTHVSGAAPGVVWY